MSTKLASQVHLGEADWDGSFHVPERDEESPRRQMKPPGAFYTSSLTPKVSEWTEKVLTRDTDLAPAQPAVFIFEPIGNPRVLNLTSNADIGNAWLSMHGFLERTISAKKTLDQFEPAKFWELVEKNYDAVRVVPQNKKAEALENWDTESVAWFHPERDLKMVSKTKIPNIEVAPFDFYSNNPDKDPDREKDIVFRQAWENAIADGAVYREVIPAIPKANGAGLTVAYYAKSGYSFPCGLSPAEAKKEQINLDTTITPYTVYRDTPDNSKVLMRYVAGKVSGDTLENPGMIVCPQDSGKTMKAFLMQAGEKIGKPIDMLNIAEDNYYQTQTGPKI